jgi:hypothetical protein
MKWRENGEKIENGINGRNGNNEENMGTLIEI